MITAVRCASPVSAVYRTADIASAGVVTESVIKNHVTRGGQTLATNVVNFTTAVTFTNVLTLPFVTSGGATLLLYNIPVDITATGVAPVVGILRLTRLTGANTAVVSTVSLNVFQAYSEGFMVYESAIDTPPSGTHTFQVEFAFDHTSVPFPAMKFNGRTLIAIEGLR